MGTERRCCKTERALEMGGGDDCTTVWMYLISTVRVMVKRLNFVLFYYNKKRIEGEGKVPSTDHQE